MHPQSIFVENIETSYSDKTLLNPSFVSLSPYQAKKTATQINYRLSNVSRRVNQLQTSKSITKTNNKFQYQEQTKYKPLNFGGVDKEHDKTYEQVLNQNRKCISQYSKKIEQLEDRNYQLEQKQVEDEQKYLKMQKKYIMEINKLNQYFDKFQRKQLEYETSKIELQKQLEKQRLKVRKIQAQLHNLNKLLKKQKKNQDLLKKLKKKYHDAYYGAQGQVSELAKDIDKNLSIILGMSQNNKSKKKDFHKFFDREQLDSDKENTWDFNTQRFNNMKLSLQTNVPMKQSILMKDQLSFTNQSSNSEDLYRIMYMQAQTIQQYIV